MAPAPWWQRLALPLCAAALLVGCTTSDESPDEEAGDPSTGVLTEADMPFDPADSSGPLNRPPVLTQLTDSCVGIEQGVLYDADWEVEAAEYYDLHQWTVISAAFTPPSQEAGGDAALELIRERHDECVGDNTGSGKIRPLDIDGADFAYVVTDGAGEFNAARGYVEVDGGKLAQVSLMKLPPEEDAERVLQELMQKLG
jgi:hypothetical protein